MYIGRHEAVAQLDESQIQRMINRGVDVLNSGYNKDEIARIACRIAIGFGKREGDNEYICSELVAECFEYSGISFARNDKGFWYPGDIAKDARIKPLFELVP